MVKKSVKNIPATKKKKVFFSRMTSRILTIRESYLRRRPHRSFRLTRRRDYKRALALPGYWSLTYQVHKLLWNNKGIFTKTIIFYLFLIVISIGILSQENYTSLSQSAQDIGSELLGLDPSSLANSVAVFSGILAGSVTAPFLSFSDSQRILFGLSMILVWLTVVWILRAIMAGKKISFRDSVYSSASPLISTLLIIVVLLLQLIPISLAVISYFIAEQTGLFLNPLATTLFWLISGLMSLISLYGVVGTLLALVVVTLPGMYPVHALRAAGDIVVGRRLRILMRYMWLIFLGLVIWLVVLLPIIPLSNINLLKELPIIPLTVVLLSSFSVVWSAAYIYLLYRKIVDDSTPPA